MAQKKHRSILFIAIISVLLLVLPLLVATLQKKQDVTTKAANASTTLQFAEGSSIQVNQGDTIPLTVTLNPGTNLVSFLKVTVSYDPSVLRPASDMAFTINSTAFPSVLAGPLYSSGSMTADLSIGPDSTKAIATLTTVGEIKFTALKKTNGTYVRFTSETAALSVDTQNSASDNVIAGTTPIKIKVATTSRTGSGGKGNAKP